MSAAPQGPLELTIEFDTEEDGRHIAEIEVLPGCLAYGATQQEAMVNVISLAFSILSERVTREVPISLAQWNIHFQAKAIAA